MPTQEHNQTGVASPPPRKIVFTGGPGGGKSEVCKKLLENTTHVVVPETATELLNNGWREKQISSNASPEWQLNFQIAVAEEQLRKEGIWETRHPNGLLVLDRGLHDALAYLSGPDWTPDALARRNSSFQNRYKYLLSLLDTRTQSPYLLYIHFTTLAITNPRAYSLKNNLARSETPEQATTRDHATREAWAATGIPCREIDTSLPLDDVCAQVYKILQECEEKHNANACQY